MRLFLTLLLSLALLPCSTAAHIICPVIISARSKYQYALLGRAGAEVVPNGQKMTLVLNDEGELWDMLSRQYVAVGGDGYVTLSGVPQKGFSVQDSYLCFGDTAAFGVEGGRLAFGKRDRAFLGVGIRVRHAESYQQSPKGQSPKGQSPKGQSPKGQATFGLHAVLPHSSSSIKRSSSGYTLGAKGEDLKLAFGSDKVSLFDQTGKGLFVDALGELRPVPPFGRHKAAPGFSIVNGLLAYQGSTAWSACPGDTFCISKRDCRNGISIALRVVD